MTSITPYPSVNEILLNVSNRINHILRENLIGLYLFGSLSYGDFNLNNSDIDLVAIVSTPLSLHELEQIRQLHQKIGEEYPVWRDRLECSYTPVELLINIMPPKNPRPYYGGGIFYDEATYGNEWIINNYLLYEHGISLIGPDCKKLISPIDIIEVQKACIRDLFQEWEPKIIDFDWLDNSHYQSYLVMNLCRILYTVMCGSVGTKKLSAAWVINKFELPWSNLIAIAASWKYGDEMFSRNEVIDFIKFTIDTIEQTMLFHDMYPDEKRYGIRHIADFLDRIIAWAKTNKEITGVVLVGSYARNQAKKDSDIDLVILTNKADKYISDCEWLKQFGEIQNIKSINYGALTSWHVNYKNNHEVEFGITMPNWTDIPVEQGTREVVNGGIIILHDPRGLFRKLMADI